MALLRSENNCPIFGSGCDLALNVLPTYEDILRYFLLVHHSKKGQYKDLVAESCEEVSTKLEEIWNRASIPIIDHRSIERRIRSYYDKYRSLLKPFKARKDVESYRQQLFRFRQNAQILFDIATCRCESFDNCTCEKIRKIPIKERNFLLDQRTDRKMAIGGVDRETTKKITSLLARKRRHVDVELDGNKSTLPGPSCSSSSRLSEKCVSFTTSTNQYNMAPKVAKDLPIVARTLDRYSISDRAGAAIVSAVLQDVGLISQNNMSNVVDRSKIRRIRLKKRSAFANELIIFDSNQFGIYFDGRKDKTLALVDNRRKVIIEEHVSLIKEPNGEYIGHISLKVGKSQAISNGIIYLLCEKNVNLANLVAIGCDGTAVNTGHKGGVIRNLEIHLKRPLQWFICQLHANELSLRHLFEYIDGKTTGPQSFNGIIGKSLIKCEQLPVAKFNSINCLLPQVTNQKDLSTDQLYLLEMCEAIDSGFCNNKLSKRNPGKMVHSRWLTMANRILRLYITNEKPSADLLTLTTFVLKVYAPIWFHIKIKPSCIYGAKHLHQTILLSRYLPNDLKAIIDPVIQRNGFFGHHENILLAMLADNRKFIRELALRRILKGRQTQGNSNQIRTFQLPIFNFDAEDYINLINWENVTEPPITKFLTDDTILQAIADQNIIDSTILPAIMHFPSHTQATERCVKIVTEASATVCGPVRRDGLIKTRLESRKIMPVFNTKSQYRTE